MYLKINLTISFAQCVYNINYTEHTTNPLIFNQSILQNILKL